MNLSEDIWTLRSLRTTARADHERETLDRVIAILEPLAELGDEQVEYLQSRAEMIGARRTHIPFKHGSWAALAASLTALRGQR